MPSSFSRFLSQEEMLKVRELYLQSLEDDEEEEDDAADDADIVGVKPAEPVSPVSPVEADRQNPAERLAGDGDGEANGSSRSPQPR